MSGHYVINLNEHLAPHLDILLGHLLSHLFLSLVRPNKHSLVDAPLDVTGRIVTGCLMV